MTWILWHKAANDGETSSNEAQKKGEKHLNEDIFTKRRDITDIDLPTVLEYWWTILFAARPGQPA